MTSYGPKHAARSLNPEQVRAAADRADGTVPEPAASPTGDKGGVYSITALAEMAGFHRDTISDWTRRKENPLPTVSGGSHGVEYRISLRCLIEWREDQARVEGAFQFMGIKAPYKAIMAGINSSAWARASALWCPAPRCRRRSGRHHHRGRPGAGRRAPAIGRRHPRRRQLPHRDPDGLARRRPAPVPAGAGLTAAHRSSCSKYPDLSMSSM